MSYFIEPCPRSKNKIKVELDLSNYATKSGLKGTTGINAWKFAKTTNLGNLKLVSNVKVSN